MHDSLTIPFPVRLKRRKLPVVTAGVPFDCQSDLGVCVVETPMRCPGNRVLGPRSRKSSFGEESAGSSLQLRLGAIFSEPTLENGSDRGRSRLAASGNRLRDRSQGLEIETALSDEVVDDRSDVTDRARSREVDDGALDRRYGEIICSRDVPLIEIVRPANLDGLELVGGARVHSDDGLPPGNAANAVNLGCRLVGNNRSFECSYGRSHFIPVIPDRYHSVCTPTDALPSVPADPTIDHPAREADRLEEAGGDNSAMLGSKGEHGSISLIGRHPKKDREGQ